MCDWLDEIWFQIQLWYYKRQWKKLPLPSIIDECVKEAIEAIRQDEITYGSERDFEYY